MGGFGFLRSKGGLREDLREGILLGRRKKNGAGQAERFREKPRSD